MRRNIFAGLLLVLLWTIPNSAQSQTRFFERGDSGLILTYDLIANQGSGNRLDWEWGAHASYTYKGMFDVGGGFVSDPYKKGPWFLMARAVIIQPKSTAGLGLEINGRYSQETTDRYYNPIFAEDWDRSYSSGLRAFYRNGSANLIVGFGGRYTFNKDQTLDHSGEVVYGHDYGEVGFALDCHFLAWRLVHFSLLTEYAQNNIWYYREDWLFRVVLGAGFTIGLNQATGGESREQ